MNVYKRSAKIGGAATALDGIDGDVLVDGDFAFVFDADLTAYELDADSGLADDGLTVIAPDVNAGTKRWVRRSFAEESPALTGNPTSTTPGNTDNSNRIATTAHIFNTFSGNASTSGYQKFKSGIVFQWGSVIASATPGAAVSVTFPLAFTSAFQVVTSGITTNTINAATWWSGLTTTGFSARAALAGQSVAWFAVGYITPA